jgi:cholesterol oxidase
MAMSGYDYDVLVIGSGFGGSVTALRLTEKGYRVAVLEAGRRFDETTLPKTSWRARSFLWAPALGLRGIQRIHLLGHAVVLAGAGVGGGSLVYANTLYVPPKAFFADPQWRDITDWEAELAPYYDQASRMLGVVRNPTMTPADVAMKAVADEMGVGHTFGLTPVGVFFGDGPGVPAADPFFGGAGPSRAGCTECGACMTGCRHNAKNTLPKNYLGLAEAAGTTVLPDTGAVRIRPLTGGGFAVDTRRPGAWVRRQPATLTAEQVVVSAGAYNTQRLLHRMRDDGHLPGLSPALGRLSRSNSESLVGAVAKDTSTDYTRGVAITSSFYPEAHTHIEPVRYGKGSNAMGLLNTILTDGGGPRPRWATWLGEAARHPGAVAASLNVRRWSERAVIALVMQTVDNSLTVRSSRTRLGRWRLVSEQGHGEPNPTWIPVANDAVRRLAKVVRGRAMGNLGDLVNRPMTAHFIGGCAIGATPDDGVVDAYHRAYGHPGLHVVDGSTVSANLGVNPSLTITAQAERAMALWPNRGDADLRPPLGSGYQPVPAVPPRHPVVPATAPGALRLPVVAVRPGSYEPTG